MKGRQILVCVLALGLLLALAVGLSQAQGPEPPEGEMRPQGETGMTANVGSRIPVQGRLTDASGNPLSGTYTIDFYLYDALTDGNLVCDDDANNDVPVSDGLFTWEIWGDCGSDAMNGQQLYLEIRVEGETLSPRQPIYPVPYAFSLRPGAVISETTSYVGLNRYVSILPFTYKYGVYAKASGALYNYGVAGYSEENYGAGVLGSADSSSGYGGYFLNTAASGVGLYAKGSEGGAADMVLGGEGSGGNDDDGRILSDPAYNGSDIYLVSNDAIVLDLDNDNDEDGDLEVRNSGKTTILKAGENGGVNLGIDAGGATTINIGDRYRDNAIVAWAKLLAGDPGSIQAEFGISAVDHYATGCYKIYLDISAAEAASLIPMAIAEIDSAPDSAAEIRIVSVNQLQPTIFDVYINDGNGNLVDNDFVFMVTAR